MKKISMFLFVIFSVVSVEAQELRVIEPVIGYTPDISVNAKQNIITPYPSPTRFY